MRRHLMGALAASVVALGTYGCNTGIAPRQNAEAREGTPPPGETSQALLNGTDAGGAASTTVALFLDGYTRVCSGTLLTPRWVLTSASCVPADGSLDMAIQTDASHTAFPSRILSNPDLEVALIEASIPFVMTPAVRALYNASPTNLQGQTVTAYGAGNGSTTDPKPDPNDLGLRKAAFTVDAMTADGYTLKPAASNANVALVAGDEGGGTMYTGAGGTFLTGVHVKDAAGTFHDVSSRGFHDWVTEQIGGVASYADAFTRDPDTGLLVAGTSEQKTWSPCGTGKYTWVASYDFGDDGVGSIGTVMLSGASVATGRATGALTLKTTTAATEVWGIRSLTATCDAAQITCLGAECVTNPTSVTSQTAKATWQPCGQDGCFAWGATLTATKPGDFIRVDGVSATKSTLASDPPVGATCGSVPVDVTVGTGVGLRTAMDVWAICGCDDAKHTCAAAPSGHARCGTRSNQCGMPYDCGACKTGATCQANECVCPTGWTANADGSCTDNCAVNNGGCDAAATCTNDPTSKTRVSCTCHAGYVGSGTSCTRNPKAVMTTNVAPAVASTPDGALFFATDRENRIYSNRVVLGQASQGWYEVGGGGRTNAPPAVALCGNSPYIFATMKGLDGYVYLNQAGLGGPWVGWNRERSMQTNVGTAVAKTPDGVLLFATQTDGRIFSNRIVLGQASQGWVEVGGGGRTDAAPSAALCGNAPYIFAAVKGYDGYVYLNQADLGGPWVGWRADRSIQTDVAPAVVQTPDGVLLFVKDRQGKIFSSRIVLGQAGQGWVEVGGQTDASPAAALTGNAPYIFAAVKGLNGNFYLNQADLGGRWVGWQLQ